MTDLEYKVQVALGLLPNPHDLEIIVVYQAAANNIVSDVVPYPGFMHRIYGKGWQYPFGTCSDDILKRTVNIIRKDSFAASFRNKSVADPAIRKQLLNKVIKQL